MRIGLISDTHIPEAGNEVPAQVKTAFRGVELIFHAGDLHVLAVLDWLQAIAPVLAARGDGDSGGGSRTPVPEDPRMKDAHVVSIEGVSVGLTHGLDYPEPPWRSLEAAMQAEFGRRVDVIVFGGSHVALVENYRGILLVNPGSPTLPRGLRQLGTVGLLEVTKGEAHARIIGLQSLSSELSNMRIFQFNSYIPSNGVTPAHQSPLLSSPPDHASMYPIPAPEDKPTPPRTHDLPCSPPRAQRSVEPPNVHS